MAGNREDIESMDEAKTGILDAKNTQTGEWRILSGGERFFFAADACESADNDNGEKTFNDLCKGDTICFVAWEGVEFNRAKHVGLISHKGVANFVHRTWCRIESIVHAPEKLWPPTTGAIKVVKHEPTGMNFGYITPTDGTEDVFFGSFMCTDAKTFETIYKLFDEWERVIVSFNLHESARGRSAFNVAIAVLG